MTGLIERDARRDVLSSKPLLVLDFGCAPFAGPEPVAAAAREIATEIERGNAVVAVLPPYQDPTLDVASLAFAVSAVPNPRELDLLISSAALMATALCGLAVRGLGHPVIALEPGQAGIVTDGQHTCATVTGIETGRIEHELQHHAGVLVSGSVGTARWTHEVTVLGVGPSELVSTLAKALRATPRKISRTDARLHALSV